MAGFSIILLMGIFSSVFLFIVILFLIYAFICLFNYFMESFALYRMCQSNKYKHPILAWIPYYNRVLLGDFADDKKMGYITFICKTVSLLILIYISYFINKNNSTYSGLYKTFNYLTIILSIVSYILNVILVHKIMKKSIPKAADVLTVLNVITFGISRAIVLFVLRNNKALIKQENLK